MAQNGIDLSAVEGWVFDLDGTLVLSDDEHDGYHALPGAIELIAMLRAKGQPLVVMTNGVFATPAEYLDILNAIGFDLRAGEMMTPASIAADYLVRRKARRILVLGGAGVWRPLAQAGLEVVTSGQIEDHVAGIDTVMVGWDPDFNVASLRLASAAIWAGARLYVTSMAPFFATHKGRTIGLSAAIASALAKTTGRRAILLGKPSRHAMSSAARALGTAMDRICVVGDDPKIESAMARKAGALSVGVESGLARRADFVAMAPNSRPHLVVPDVEALRLAIGG